MADALETPTEVIDDIPSIDDSTKLFDQSVAENKPMYRDWETDRKSTRLNSSHSAKSRMPSSA